MKCPLIGLITLLFAPLLCYAQQISVEPIPHAPPAIFPGGIQVIIFNRTSEAQQLRVRPKGGNWILVKIPVRNGRNLRCEGCTGSLEVQLPDDDVGLPDLTPGIAYEIRQGRKPGEIVVQPVNGPRLR
jgi:hypothetical protein